ncbi:MAG: DMT family transporter [Elusimicrobiaceae bacterium]|nr:DMT family transporter [Elusimicrobiaceae bacterium]
MSYVLALSLALCWGTAFLASKNIVEALPPWWSTFFRVGAGLLFFIIFYGIQRKNLKCPFRELWRPWTIGLLLILFPFAAISWGQQFVDPTVGGIFNGTVPIWSFLAGAVLLKGVDRFTWRRAAGVTVGLIGLLIFMYPTLSSNPIGTSSSALYGCLAMLAMAWSYSLGNVLTKKIMVDSNAVSLEANTFHQYLFSAIALLGIASLTEPLPALAAFSSKVIISILCAGIFSSAIAFLLMVTLIQRWGATRMASITYFTPIVAMGTDILFRHRMPHFVELIGIGLIFISLWLIQKKVSAR